MLGRFVIAAPVAATLAVGAVPAVAQDAVELPRSMIWSAYDVGSGGYTEASAIANAVQGNFDTRVRVLPSGTSIGRLLPLREGKADYGFLSNELFFANEGMEEFAAPDWGPQEVRVILGRPASVGIIAAADVNAESVEDLRGKRVGFVKGNPALNIKTDAYLAFGGLTRDDVEQVWFGSYGALKDAIISNQLDAMGMVPTSSFAREIEASARGLTWLSFDPGNEQGWKNATDVISFAEPYKQTTGAGISEENPVWLLGYRYPMLATYSETDEDAVYNLVKAIDQSFDGFKDATADAKNWSVDHAILPPADAPFHEGAIRYAKEMGYWTEEAQAWQDERLAREDAVEAAWAEARAAHDGSDDDWSAFWNDWRAEHLTD
ncbi:TAXI family TRAP transporter solute-binding subunit [Mangrovicoccus algicola]|uniref:TAXI family TRAP transporter solute-binding subunit n=1 Tax=Mangrovicoccus algicola TaxID=2771008 RepID=A0A8J7CVJ1_9RHOB|nr:TAXI family TRAP transporter solute-binding subunit [Mangrovicoccus algicola]MBE3638789.1 TAXI family TRAP transporter solute-binding subunit [Mangrovicoccus algicola]